MRMFVQEKCCSTSALPLLQPHLIFHQPLAGSAVIQLVVFEVHVLALSPQGFYRSVYFLLFVCICV